MPHPSSDLTQLLRSLHPVLHDGAYVFAMLPSDADASGIQSMATFRETEGLTVILEEDQARRAGLTPLFRAAWITLRVHSDLNAVGLTAAVATALAAANIGCNIVAAACHDHVFVPFEDADKALATLKELQDRARPQ